MSIIKKFKDFKQNFDNLDDIAAGFGELADKLNKKLEQRIELTYVEGHPELPQNIRVLLVLDDDPLLIVYGGSILKKIKKKQILGARLDSAGFAAREEGGLGGIMKAFFSRKKKFLILSVKEGQNKRELLFAGKKIQEKLLKLKKFAGVQ